MVIGLLGIPIKEVNAEEITQEYVIVAENDKGYDKVESTYTEIEKSQSEELECNNVMVVNLTESEANKLEKDKNIAFVEKNILFEGSDFEDESFEDVFGMDELFEDEEEKKQFLKDLRGTENASIATDEQWNIEVINANEQEYKQVTDKVKVAVLDTGITATEDINVAGRINFILGEEDVNPLYEDVSGHGTSVASVIAAKDNGIGVTGINPNVELYSVKVLDDKKRASLSEVIKGIYWCIDNDIDIINMSFGTSVESEILKQVVKEADEKNILMIAAAGNRGVVVGESTVEYPAAFDEVIAVGATNPQGKTSEISSVGEEIDLMAPGEIVPATGYYDEIIETEGTSMAAPHVTGIASILWGKDKGKSNKFIKQLLNASAKSMEDETREGNGFVDLDYALSIYDEFAIQYDEEQAVPVLEENKEEIKTYEEAEIEASWNWRDHQSAVGAYDQTSASALNVIKIGAKIPDTESYLKYKNGVTAKFHGHGNYVASYMYVMNMARNCINSGMTAALNTPHPVKENDKSQIYDGIVTLNKNWNTVLSGYTINNANKARILVGIASHIAMDTYAHKAYIKDTDGYWTKHISGDDKQDSTTYVPCRWTCAKNIAYDIVDVWHYGLTPNAAEFHLDSHDKNKFRLAGFYSNVSSADPVNYNRDSTWYKDRTAEQYVIEEIE